MANLLDRAAHAIAKNDMPTAEALSRQLLSYDTSNTQARLILGAVYARTHRFEDAVRELEQVLATEPNSVQALRWNAEALRKLGRIGEAISCAERAVDLEPGSTEALYLRAMCFIAMGRYAEAELDLRIVVSKERAPAALHFLGLSLARQDRIEEAVTVLAEASRREPGSAQHWVVMGQAHFSKHMLKEAAACAKTALKLDGDDIGANLLMANIGSFEGFTDQSEPYIARALKVNPNSAEANGNYGLWLHQMGRFAEAEAFIDKALELNPQQSMPLFFKVENRKVTAEDDDLIARMESRASTHDATPQERLVLHYGLGKAYVDLGKLVEAFAHYKEANQLGEVLHRAREPYDPGKLRAFADRCQELFRQGSFKLWSTFGSASERPILVVGAIRSGTTLMEQLLSAHSEVEGAGELHYWPQNAVMTLNETGTDLDPQKIQAASEGYLQVLSQRFEVSQHVTDKMPTNFWMLGFIHACLPNVKIIDMVRDPIDVALSIWMTYISHPPAYAHVKSRIVEALQQHQRLRKHWKNVLPPDRYKQVNYEELVAKPEEVMKEVLEYLGLAWQKACVHPEKNERFISTPSLYRVRRPIDTRSVSKRERFADFLGEFADLRELE